MKFPAFFVMAGLVPAIHVFLATLIQDVDARVKPGHDDGGARRDGDKSRACPVRCAADPGPSFDCLVSWVLGLQRIIK
jgi:hypothetical protein